METLSIKRKPSGAITARNAPPVETAAPEAIRPPPVPAPPQEYPDLLRALQKHSLMQKIHKSNIYRMRRYWPEAFPRKTPRPLAVGITSQLLADAQARTIDIDLKGIERGLASYCGQRSYLMMFAFASVRVNLDGSTAAEITDKDREYAARLLAKKNALVLKFEGHAERVKVLEKQYGIIEF